MRRLSLVFTGQGTAKVHPLNKLSQLSQIFQNLANVIDSFPLTLQVRIRIQQMTCVKHKAYVVKFDPAKKVIDGFRIKKPETGPPGIFKQYLNRFRYLSAYPVKNPGRHFHHFSVRAFKHPGILFCRCNLFDPVNKVLRFFDQCSLNIAFNL